MHAYQHINPALAGLLQFEEQRLGLPVEVIRKPLKPLRPTALSPGHRSTHPYWHSTGDVPGAFDR